MDVLVGGIEANNAVRSIEQYKKTVVSSGR